MAKKNCLKKSFQDSLEDIKERMKEKRNKKLAKLGKNNSILSAKCKIITNNSTQLKSFQENNRALALALEDERNKMREAQTAILHLKKECHFLKFQLFGLKKKLISQRAEEPAQAKLSTLRGIIYQVTQKLVETVDLLNPAKDLCSSDLDQRIYSTLREEYFGDDTLTDLTVKDSREFPRCVPIHDAGLPRKSEVFQMEDNAAAKKEKQLGMTSGQSSGNTITIRKNSFRSRRSDVPQDPPDFNIESSSNEEGRPTCTSLPKGVSTRRHRLTKSHNELCDTMLLGDLETTYLSREFCERDGTAFSENPTGTLAIENPEENICLYGQDQITSVMLMQPGAPTEIKCTLLDPQQKQIQVKNRDVQAETRPQKRKSSGIRKPSKSASRSKERQSRGKKTGPKEKLEESTGTGDAYDFYLEESVHLTPFRPSKVNKEEMEEKCMTDDNLKEKSVSLPETSSSESSGAEEDSDELYVPFKKKSKFMQSLACKSDMGSVPMRPRSKRSLKPQKYVDEKENNTAKLTNIGADCENQNHLKAVSMDDPSVFKMVEMNSEGNEEEEETRKNLSSADNHSLREVKVLHIGATSGTCQTPHLGLKDVTNISSPSTANCRNRSTPFTCTEEKPAVSMRKRRCTLSVNYKEPALATKLRRGDPFTDTYFLNSPVFKQRKSGKRRSLKKDSLSKYNEAFVGCR
ncbi:shugoshin 1 isoform X2 [Tachyglossus aculeatus]|uniref:shugoshin 1 isoform X2 n=1 Tax=Tachyglossus aculeatus TaxID=9261 RepID=UPI0018F441D0|nr:shugoshin 1 isoform X2 [Tachyglossus aculeatus]